MLWVNVKRIIRTGFLNFGRNAFVSLSSVMVMIVALAVIGSMVFVSATLNAALAEIKEKVDINVYFVPEAPEDDIQALRKTLEALPEIASVEYVSREQALENFRSRYANDQITLQSLDELGENPLGASLNIRANDPSQYSAIAQYLEGEDLLSSSGNRVVDRVNYRQNQKMIENLSRFIDTAERFGTALIAVMIGLSIIITFNTIRLAIYISREEIAVMRLVGASSFYIRGPFVVAGTIYGILAGIVTLILFYPLTIWLSQGERGAFLGFSVFEYYTANFGEMFLVVIGSGMLIGAISSFLAVRKYLKT
jgi:cell division transport system permease protein